MRKESKEGFKGRLNKAIGYIGIGVIGGFILGVLLLAEIDQRKSAIWDSNRIALTGYYTEVVVNKMFMDEDGEIWIIDSEVEKVYKDE